MALNNVVGFILALVVLVLMYKALGPKWQKPSRKRQTRKRTVRVDPLVARERRLAVELRHVRAQIRDRESANV